MAFPSYIMLKGKKFKFVGVKPGKGKGQYKPVARGGGKTVLLTEGEAKPLAILRQTT